MDEIVEGKIYVINDFLNDSQCSAFIDFIDEREKVSTEQQPYSYRFQESLEWPDFADAFWKVFCKKVPTPQKIKLGVSGVSSRIPYVRYDADAKRTSRHTDHRWAPRSINTVNAPIEIFGMIIYLNDDFPGGDTSFYNIKQQEIFRMKPKRGSVVIFHMDTCHLGHEPKGIKYIICPRLVNFN